MDIECSTVKDKINKIEEQKLQLTKFGYWTPIQHLLNAGSQTDK